MNDEIEPIEERLLRAAARGFELESSVEVDDAARIERVARQFETSRTRRGLLPVRRFALGMAAAFLLVGTVVGAIQLTKALENPPLPLVSTSDAPPQATPSARAARPLADRVISPAAASASAPSDKAALGLPERSPPRAVRAPEARESAELALAASVELPPPEPPRESASELFSAANKSRSRGEVAPALALYRRLQTEYPAASEALAARIAVGMLELQQGRPALALAQFKAYRQANTRALRAEALWGEAQALRALGREAEERAALESLLVDHPSSAYAPAARKRLGRD